MVGNLHLIQSSVCVFDEVMMAAVNMMTRKATPHQDCYDISKVPVEDPSSHRGFRLDL